METSIDLYSEDYANDYIDIDDEHDENGQQLSNEHQEQSEHLENEDSETNENKEEDEQKKTVKPKRVIKNPRPKLDVETLKGHKGLLCLENYFKNKQYKGRGHEEEDLRTILKTYEYWCHRLFPKSPFDECLQKLEKLGTKKNVQTYIKKIRMNLLFDDEQPVRSDNEEEHVQDMNTEEFNNLSPQHDSQIPTLTDEQLERIRINREKANQLRQEKLQRAKERAQASLSQDNSREQVTANATENMDAVSQNENFIIEDTESIEQTDNGASTVIDSGDEARTQSLSVDVTVEEQPESI